MEQTFLSICESLKAPQEVQNAWVDILKREYSGRPFHNLELIEKKLKLVEELLSDFENDKTSLLATKLATIFQYLYYDTSDLSKENCDAFKRFVEETGIKDVSKWI